MAFNIEYYYYKIYITQWNIYVCKEECINLEHALDCGSMLNNYKNVSKKSDVPRKKEKKYC